MKTISFLVYQLCILSIISGQGVFVRASARTKTPDYPVLLR